MTFELVEPTEKLARIRVAGVGGAGGNAINRMIESGLGGVEFIAVNTDLQALHQSRADQVLQIGGQATRGLGSGGDPDMGRLAMEEDLDVVGDVLDGSDMVFVTAGMGGGTGTGAAPTVARLARERGAPDRGHRHQALPLRGARAHGAGRGGSGRPARER